MRIEVPSREKIEAAVKTVFNRCRDERAGRLFTALVPIIRTAMPGYSLSPEMFDREMYELCKFVEGFECILADIGQNRHQNGSADIARLGTRLKAMIYCHIMEADYPCLILLNLLRVLNDRECCFLFVIRNQNDEIRTDAEGNPRVCEHPKDKMRLLKKEDVLAETGVADALEQLWYGDFRNAFSHSQYSIENNGMFTGTKVFSGVSGRSVSSISDRAVVLSPQDIDSLYAGTLAYLHCFINCYMETIAPFKDGGFHATELSGQPLRWDMERDQWTWNPPA